MGFITFFIQHIRRDPQAQLWIGLFVFLAVIVQVILSPMLSMVFVATTYSLVWLPQIVRSARRNRTSGLSREYILGTTACRLFNMLYFLWCPKNVLEVEPRPWAPFLALSVIFQALLLILQDTIGPSFFLPERFKATQGYNYHPPMPLPDSESPDQSLGDCAICMDAILVDPSLRSRKSESLDSEKKRGASGSGMAGSSTGANSRMGLFGGVVKSSNARKNYSLAPCCHLFHTECLEKWLAIKNICPQCRRPLPPL
ncbi:hypothetical protein CC2G_011787 [Coprinopsis cinerea AmutBmut pab1-1]|nr:hypothetical protein CC2G_011787 [Coprinopsis cinerea AmutBmut pab1-1]